VTVNALNQRGLACKAAGRYAEGRDCYLRALALVQRHARPDPDAVATLYHNLGGIEHARGDYQAAEVYARHGLSCRKALPVPDRLAVAADEVALGAILDGQGRYAESEALYTKALRVLRRSPDAPPYDLAVALHDLGTMYLLTGRLAPGRALLEEAVEIKRRALGPDHPSLATTLHNLRCGVGRRGFAADDSGAVPTPSLPPAS
jgi:tetratricopeptide (TPR) repeat protein